MVNTLLVLIMFQRHFAEFSETLQDAARKSATAALCMGVVASFALNALDKIFDITTFSGIFLQGFLSGVAALLAGSILLMLLRSREFSEVRESLSQKFWKKETVVPEQEP